MVLKGVRWILPAVIFPVLCSFGVYAQAEAPGLDILGFGYDVFGKYASQESLKPHRLFVYPKSGWHSKYGYDLPKSVLLTQINLKEVAEIKGSSRREFAEELATRAGLSGKTFFFRGSVEASYGASETTMEREYYVTYMDSIWMWSIELDTRVLDDLIEMREPQFASDLEDESLPPAQLFDTYGTHFVAKAYIGGRADFSAISKVTEDVTSRQIAGAVKATYRGISGEGEVEFANSEVLTKSETTTNLVVTGGGSRHLGDIRDKNQYKDWTDGIADMPVLCDFRGEGSLLPIWELARNQRRREALVAEFERLKEAHPLPEAIEPVDIGGAGLEVAQLKGSYTIQQVSNQRSVDAHESRTYDYHLVTRGAQNDDSQRWILTPLGEDVYTIQQAINRRYVDAHESEDYDYGVITREAQNNDTQRWILAPLGNDVYTIQQAVNRRYVDAHESKRYDFRLVTRDWQNDDSQRWLIKRAD